MKRVNIVFAIKALILAVLFIGWINVSQQMVINMELQSNSMNAEILNASKANIAANENSQRTLKKNSLYVRYWEMLKSRAKKHKV